jgi:hypothetical protein
LWRKNNGSLKEKVMALIPILNNIPIKTFSQVIKAECGLYIRMGAGDHIVTIKKDSRYRFGKNRMIRLHDYFTISSLMWHLEECYNGVFHVYYQGRKVVDPEVKLKDVGYFEREIDRKKAKNILYKIVTCTEKLLSYQRRLVASQKNLERIKWGRYYEDDFDMDLKIKAYHIPNETIKEYITNNIVWTWAVYLQPNQFDPKLDDTYFDIWHEYEITQILSVPSYYLVRRIVEDIGAENLQHIDTITFSFELNSQKCYEASESKRIAL